VAERHRIIIDTDPGIDDALAILLASASPEIDILGLTIVAGNVSLAQTTENALKLCALAGQADIPVYAGADKPLVRAPRIATVHGATGLEGADLPPPRAKPQPRHAVDWMIETLRAAPRASLRLIAIGPLTNVALALQRAPEIAAALAEVVIMGGATPKIGGNMNAYAEFNIYVDPEAAEYVFARGLPTTLVPLDLSYQMAATPDRIERFAAIPGPVGRAVAGMLRHFHKGDGNLHDPITIAWLLRPALFAGRRAAVTIETKGERSGETRFDWREDGPCRVLLEGQAEPFFDLLVERLAQL
jgi:purine nucleosidase